MAPEEVNQRRPMSREHASQLLSAVLGQQAPPLDRLLSRCLAQDGRSWSAAFLRALDSKTKTIADCQALKEHAKADLARPSDEGHDPAAFLQYLYAIAAARDLHGMTISSANPGELASGLSTVASYLDEPFQSMFRRAAAQIYS